MSTIKVIGAGLIDADGIRADVADVEHFARTLLAICRSVKKRGSTPPQQER